MMVSTEITLLLLVMLYSLGGGSFLSTHTKLHYSRSCVFNFGPVSQVLKQRICKSRIYQLVGCVYRSQPYKTYGLRLDH
jgi:hypothetical protein